MLEKNLNIYKTNINHTSSQRFCQYDDMKRMFIYIIENRRDP